MINQVKKIIRKIGLHVFIKSVFQKINYTYSYSLNGARLKGLKIYDSKTENSEKWMGELLSILLPNSTNVVIDIGVNIGQTLCQVKSISPDCIYYGFEPNPSCNMFVDELIRVNKFRNVNLIPVGLYTSDELLELDLFEDSATNSGGSIIQDYWSYNGIKPKRKKIVPLMTYNTVVKTLDIKNVGLVKIDVEGAELEVLNSIREMLVNESPIIICEVLSAYSNDNFTRVKRQEGIIDLLNNINYSIFRIIEAKENSLSGLQKISFFDPYFNKNLCNYLFVPNDKVDFIKKHFKLYYEEA